MRTNNTRNYLLVTCFKNEEENLPHLLRSVTNQTITPILWLLVDDGSTDNSLHIVEGLAKEKGWVEILSLPRSERSIGIHIAEICSKGFNRIRELAKNRNLEYRFIGLLDADFEVEESYFEQLIEKMMNENGLGIVSGGVYTFGKRGKRLERTLESLPRGGARLWRKECFEQTGGYSITYSSDVVSAIHALEYGWKLRQFRDIIAIQSRPTSAGEGRLRGHIERGRGDYYLGRTAKIALFRTIRYSTAPPSLRGLAYLMGYLEGARKGLKTGDEIVRSYYLKEKVTDIMFKKRWIFDLNDRNQAGL